MSKKNQKIIDHLKEEYYATFHCSLEDSTLKSVIKEELLKKQQLFIRNQISSMELSCKELEKLYRTVERFSQGDPAIKEPKRLTKKTRKKTSREQKTTDSETKTQAKNLEDNQFGAKEYLELEALGQPLLIKDELPPPTQLQNEVKKIVKK